MLLYKRNICWYIYTHMYINSDIIKFRHPIQIQKEALWNGKIAYILSK